MKNIKMDWIIVYNDMHRKSNDTLVACIAEIRDNSTGEVREYETVEVIRNGETTPSVFNWEENNYSCDCNRHIFFKRAKDECTEKDFDLECTDGYYSVNLKNKKNGVVYYIEYTN